MYQTWSSAKCLPIPYNAFQVPAPRVTRIRDLYIIISTFQLHSSTELEVSFRIPTLRVVIVT